MAKEVADIAGKQRGILDQIALLKRRLRLDEAVLSRLKGARAHTREARDSTRKELKALEDREGRVTAYLAQRMRQQYALGILQEYRVYFAANSTQDVKAASVYLQVLAERDTKNLSELKTLHREREERVASLAELENKLRDQTIRTTRERANLRIEQRRLSSLLADLRLKKETAQRALSETLQAARRMDRYVADLAFRSRVNLYDKNMVEAKGRLLMPCPGRITRGFGTYTHPRFHTRIPHPGLDIAAPLGTPVKAVFDGVVEFADWLPGYGYTVILRHPGDYFTVYAHLDRMKAARGAAMGQGAILGTVGENADTASTSLYFELRRGAKAVSPMEWFQGGSHVK